MRAIVPKQAEAGIDVGNDGEQQRESFFLYLRERLTGLGGTWQRPRAPTSTAIPSSRSAGSPTWRPPSTSRRMEGLPMAVGEVRYMDAAAIEAECRDFADVLAAHRSVFTEAFMNAPSPGIAGGGDQEPALRHAGELSAALGEALRVEYEAIVRAGFVLQIDAPDLALERHISYKDEPVAKFVGFVESVVAAINHALRNVPRDRVRLHVCWGNSESPHDCDVPLRTSCRRCCRRMSAASCCRSPGRATRTSSAASSSIPCMTIRSWSPA